MGQGAPPLYQVLAELGALAALRDMVVVMGDDIGLSDPELEMIRQVGTTAGNGGREGQPGIVRTASLGTGALLER